MSGVLNVCGYYDGMLTQIDHMVTEGFLSSEMRDILIFDSDPMLIFFLKKKQFLTLECFFKNSSLLDKLLAHTPPKGERKKNVEPNFFLFKILGYYDWAAEDI